MGLHHLNELEKVSNSKSNSIMEVMYEQCINQATEPQESSATCPSKARLGSQFFRKRDALSMAVVALRASNDRAVPDIL